MKADSFDEVSQIRHITMKDATGTVFIVITNGRRNISKSLKRFAAIAKTAPRIKPEKKPIDILKNENERVLQKSFWVSRMKNLSVTSIGDGRRISDFKITERIYQTVRAIITAPTV